MFAILTVIYHIPLGFGFAISAMVGGAIGSGDIYRAKRITNIIFCFSITMMIIIVIMLHMFGKQICECFSDDREITDKAY